MRIARNTLLIILAAFLAEQVGNELGMAVARTTSDLSGRDLGIHLLPSKPPFAAWSIAVGNLVLAAAMVPVLRIAGISPVAAGIRRSGTAGSLILALPIVGLNLIAWASPAGGAMRLPDPDRLLGFGLLACCVALGEELFYRGALLQAFDPTRYPRMAVAAGAMVFGLFHVVEGGRIVTSPGVVANAVVVTLAIGIPFALIRVRTGSLWGLVACHAMYDLLALIVTNGFTGQHIALERAALSAVVAAITCGLYVWWFSSSGGYAASPSRLSPRSSSRDPGSR